MKTSMSCQALAEYVAAQFNNLLPDQTVTGDQLTHYVDAALERIEYCFSHINHKYFAWLGQTYFNHLHTDQYSMFLYYLGNTIHRLSGDEKLATKSYSLNKALNAIDAYYEVELPDVFFWEHPLGTVLGRAQYSNYLCVYQRVNVGGSIDEIYPRLGEGVILHGGSSIIGDCNIGDNCWLSAGAVVMDQDIPSDSVVFGRSPDTTIKPTQRSVKQHLFQSVGHSL